MPANRLDRSFIEHDNPLRLRNRAEMMGNDNQGPAARQRVDRRLNGRCVNGVDRSARFIQHDDRGVFKDRPGDGDGDGDALPLAARQRLPLTACPGRIALWESGNKPGSVACYRWYGLVSGRLKARRGENWSQNGDKLRDTARPGRLRRTRPAGYEAAIRPAAPASFWARPMTGGAGLRPPRPLRDG